MAGLTGKCNTQVDSDIDVTEDDGSIIIADKIPDNWPDAPDIQSYRSLDRNFVFAGEQVQLLVCLSARKNTGIIKPSQNVIGQRSPRQKDKLGSTIPVSQAKCANTGLQNNLNGEARWNIESEQDLSTGQILQSFKNSHFFARIAESNETLWSQRSSKEASIKLTETSIENLAGDSSESEQNLKNKNSMSVVIDRGGLHSPTSGGVARGAAKCCSLLNGDIVVLLQVKVGVEFMRDPIIEILQFEKYHERDPFFENQQTQASFVDDRYGELLNWLLPLNNARRPSTDHVSPRSTSSSSIRGTHTKRAASLSSGSELFSFGHFRSYSMSSLQPYNSLPEAMSIPSAKPSLVPEDQYQFSFQSSVESHNGNEKLLSFRGVTLAPGRFSVQCGLEGVFTHVRRWRRKIDLMIPLEIHSYSIDCNTDDILCVHIKNVSPAYAPDLVVFIDSITMVSEETSSGGPSLSLPVTCTQAGNDYSLPNLALRRGEEHSFILKPVMMSWRHSKDHTEYNRRRSRLSTRASRSRSLPSSNPEWRQSPLSAVQYAVLISCRCNYTESKLFYRHPVSWKPRIARELMISAASEISKRTLAADGTQLPVEGMTLLASNVTSDDLTLTVLDPPSSTSSTHVSMCNLPFSPLSPFEGGVNPYTDLSCTHLCLKSRVPLGRVPSQSTVAFGLDVLPLTDGMISLDSLQIDVKERGRIYIPKPRVKIGATPSIAPVIK